MTAKGKKHFYRLKLNKEFKKYCGSTSTKAGGRMYKHVKQVKGEVGTLPSLTKQPEDSLLAEEEGLLKKREEALTHEKAARLARIKQVEEEKEESRRLEDEFKKKKAMFLPRPSVSPSTVKKNPPPPPASQGKVPPPPTASPSLYQVPPVQSSSIKAPIPSEPISYSPTIDVENFDPPAVVLPTVVPPPPPAAPAPLSGLLSASTNPFHRLGSSNNSSACTTPATLFPSKLSSGNPFFKPSVAPDPNSDNEWYAKEKDDEDDDSNEEGATTARQARQCLAEALFASAPPAPSAPKGGALLRKDSGHQSPLPTHAEESPKRPAEEDGLGDKKVEDAYKSQCPEDLSLVENIVIEAHPSKTDNDWLHGTDVKSGRMGTFPKAYVTELEGELSSKLGDVYYYLYIFTVVTWGKVLYDYTASSAHEVSLIEDEMVAVINTSDPDWLKVEEQGRVGLAPGAYIELSG
ncbi:hypothetical protein PPACK8108_LOCUS16020 [Phakopsora pachyrhizi]|uniref:SH3 domain-containing protein n=1 Tax=Phakopsora pachyrhizi TaxID=170000 RepID=A0AAV0BAS3_PHAPC|nr:hypothetical protein PPACK8108_LOCUS16020 [Phakopsora pachyrhizi]